MKSTTKRPRVGRREAQRLRDIAKQLGKQGNRRVANELRSIAEMIAPEVALRRDGLTYVYRLLRLLPLKRGTGQKINKILGDMYDVNEDSVPVIASRNRKSGDRQISRLYGGADQLSTERVIEEIRAMIPVTNWKQQWRLIRQLINDVKKR